MIEVKRYDRLALPGDIKRTDEGFIAADPVVTRTGIFKYRMPDGSIRRELRLPEEVFDAESLASAKMIPITNLHPTEFVTPENVGDLAIGMTGENVRRDEDTVRVPVKITNKDGVEAVEGGRLQLSLGYKCQLEMKGGEWEGERYDAVQRRIRYNHLALCDKARAGAQATLRLDAVDAVMVEIGQDQSGSRKEKRKMPPPTVSMKLDSSGISYDVPAEVEAEYGTIRKDRDDAVTKRDALQAELDKLQGTHDAQTKELEELKKVDNADAVAAGVKARVALLETVKPMLSEEDAKKADSMTDKELRIAAIKSQDKDFEDAERVDGYIEGAFEAAVKRFAESEKTKREDGKTVIGDGSAPVDAKDVGDAREKMKARRDGTAKDEGKGKE